MPRQADDLTTPIRRPPADLDRGQLSPDAHSMSAPATLRQANSLTTPTARSPADLDRGHIAGDTQATTAPATLNGSHAMRDTQSAIAADSSGGQHARDAQEIPALDSWPLLKLYADAVDDLERTRIATENRVRSLRDVKGLVDTPEERRLVEMVKALAKIERAAVRDLERAMKQHPLSEWVERNRGVGLKTMARLLAAIGDPNWRFDPETGEVKARTVSQLWAYCGLDVRNGKAPKHARGVQSNWNEDARMRFRLMAESCLKANSPWRAVYDAGRAKYADRDATDLHKHNMALRLLMKELAKDMWRFGRGVA